MLCDGSHLSCGDRVLRREIQFTNTDSGRDLLDPSDGRVRRAYHQNLLESLILAQDERWRRA